MKRMLAVLMLLLLAAACGTGTAEETVPQPGLFDLYSAEGEDPVWLGTAVPLFDGVLITSAAVLPEDLSRLVISDGWNVWDAEAAARDREGLGAVILVDTDMLKPATGVFELEEDAVRPADCFVLTGDQNSSRVYREVYAGAEMDLRTYPCRLLSISGPVGPGSPLITESGRLAGIAVGEWAEGTDRVLFLTAEGIYQSMSEALGKLTGAETGFRTY